MNGCFFPSLLTPLNKKENYRKIKIKRKLEKKIFVLGDAEGRLLLLLGKCYRSFQRINACYFNVRRRSDNYRHCMLASDLFTFHQHEMMKYAPYSS